MSRGRTPQGNGGGATAGLMDSRALDMSHTQYAAWLCLHAIVFAVPLAMGNWTWLPGVSFPVVADVFELVKVFLMRGLAFVAAACVAWHLLVEGGALRRTQVDLLIAAILAWVTVSTVFSIHVPTAVLGTYQRYEGAASYFTYALLYFIVVQLIDRVSRVRSLARTLFLSGSLVSAYGVLQYLGIDPAQWGERSFEYERAFSTYGNPNLLAGFLVLVLPVSLGLALSEQDRRWRVAYWIGFIVSAVCLIATFTRGAWIGGTVALIVVGFAVWRMRVHLTRVDWSFLGALAALATVVIGRSVTMEDPVLNAWRRIVTIFQFDSGSAFTRFEIWDAAWRATLDRPVLGHGPDTFRLVFPGYKSVDFAEVAGLMTFTDNVHNHLLQLMTSIGIPGMLLVYALFAVVAVRTFPAAFPRQASAADSGRLVVAAFWAASAGYLVHLAFGLSIPGSTFLLWIGLATLMASSARTVRITTSRSRQIVAYAVMAMLAAASVANVWFVSADRHYLESQLQDRHESRVAAAAAAVRANPLCDVYRVQTGIVHAHQFRSLVAEAQALGEGGEDPGRLLEVAESEFSEARHLLAEAIEFNPYRHDTYQVMTDIHLLAARVLSEDYHADAVEWASRGVDADPLGAQIRYQYATALDGADESARAREELEELVGLYPRHVDALVALGHIYLRESNGEAALERFEQVAVIAPDLLGIQGLIDEAAGLVASPGEGDRE